MCVVPVASAENLAALEASVESLNHIADVQAQIDAIERLEAFLNLRLDHG